MELAETLWLNASRSIETLPKVSTWNSRSVDVCGCVTVVPKIPQPKGSRLGWWGRFFGARPDKFLVWDLASECLPLLELESERTIITKLISKFARMLWVRFKKSKNRFRPGCGNWCLKPNQDDLDWDWSGGGSIVVLILIDMCFVRRFGVVGPIFGVKKFTQNAKPPNRKIKNRSNWTEISQQINQSLCINNFKYVW